MSASWGGSQFSARSKQKSLEEAQEKFRKQRSDAVKRARYCQCPRPVANLGTYGGWKMCRLCNKLIYEERP